jgi:Uma2 family endonuclease
MTRVAIKLGPGDHGKRMSLADFDHADVQEGYLYELSRGVITVSDVPHPRHLAQVDIIREQFYTYRTAHPGRIYRIAAGSECKILLAELESERHPDLVIYKSPPPGAEEIWSTWIPDIVIEVVSPGSEHRDYTEKREEYLAFGVQEYWIFNADQQEMLVLRRVRGRWSPRTLRPPKVCRTRLLPGLQFSCEKVFQAASEYES